MNRLKSSLIACWYTRKRNRGGFKANRGKKMATLSVHRFVTFLYEYEQTVWENPTRSWRWHSRALFFLWNIFMKAYLTFATLPKCYIGFPLKYNNTVWLGFCTPTHMLPKMLTVEIVLLKTKGSENTETKKKNSTGECFVMRHWNILAKTSQT